ncbi:MAG: lactate utilization protein C [Acidimicrobiia bacterium]
MDRDTFLARVGQAAMGSKLPLPAEQPGPLPEIDDGEDLLALFRRRAVEVDAVVHGPVSRSGAARAVVGIAAGHGAVSFMAWDDLPASGVVPALIEAGLKRVDHQVPEDGRVAHHSSYRRLDLGVTGSLAGLAESGSVALTHGAGRPRMASLVPEIHVALVEVETMERTLAHWAEKHPEAVRDTTNLVVVTGPSRTGDIELQLNLGVHGPRHLHIVLMG